MDKSQQPAAPPVATEEYQGPGIAVTALGEGVITPKIWALAALIFAGGAAYVFPKGAGRLTQKIERSLDVLQQPTMWAPVQAMGGCVHWVIHTCQHMADFIRKIGFVNTGLRKLDSKIGVEGTPFVLREKADMAWHAAMEKGAVGDISKFDAAVEVGTIAAAMAFIGGIFFGGYRGGSKAINGMNQHEAHLAKEARQAERIQALETELATLSNAQEAPRKHWGDALAAEPALDTGRGA